MRIEGGSTVVPWWFRCLPGLWISFFEKSKMTHGRQGRCRQGRDLVPTWCRIGPTEKSYSPSVQKFWALAP